MLIILYEMINDNELFWIKSLDETPVKLKHNTIYSMRNSKYLNNQYGKFLHINTVKHWSHTDFFKECIHLCLNHVIASCWTAFYHTNLEDTFDLHMRITGGFIDHLRSWNHGKALKIAVGIAAQKWSKWGQFHALWNQH